MKSKNKKKVLTVVMVLVLLGICTITFIANEIRKKEEAIVANLNQYNDDLEKIVKDKDEYILNIKNYFEEDVEKENVDSNIIDNKFEAIEYLDGYNVEVTEFEKVISGKSIEDEVPEDRLGEFKSKVLDIKNENNDLIEKLKLVVKEEFIESCNSTLNEADKEDKEKLQKSNEKLEVLIEKVLGDGIINFLTEEESLELKERAEELLSKQEELIEKIEKEEAEAKAAAEKAAAEKAAAVAKAASSSSSSSSSSNSSSSSSSSSNSTSTSSSGSSSSSGETLGKGSWYSRTWTNDDGTSTTTTFYADGSVKKTYSNSSAVDWWTKSQYDATGFSR